MLSKTTGRPVGYNWPIRKPASWVSGLFETPYDRSFSFWYVLWPLFGFVECETVSTLHRSYRTLTCIIIIKKIKTRPDYEVTQAERRDARGIILL